MPVNGAAVWLASWESRNRLQAVRWDAHGSNLTVLGAGCEEGAGGFFRSYVQNGASARSVCECARANDSQVTQPQGKASGRRPYIRDACWDLSATHPRRAAGERPFRCHSCAAVRSLCMRLRAPVRLALLLCIAWPAGWCARGMLSVLRDAVPGCGGALRNV